MIAHRQNAVFLRKITRYCLFLLSDATKSIGCLFNLQKLKFPLKNFFRFHAIFKVSASQSTVMYLYMTLSLT